MEGSSTDVKLVVDVETTVSELMVKELAVDSSVSELAVTVWVVDAEMVMLELAIEVVEIEVVEGSSSTSAV